jgi:hypothetical protein
MDDPDDDDDEPVNLASSIAQLSDVASKEIAKAVAKCQNTRILQEKKSHLTENSSILLSNEIESKTVSDSISKLSIQISNDEVSTIQKNVLETNNQVKAAICDGEFLELAGDILRNTMFNLIQEAAFGDFAIDADPHKFVLRR